MGGKPYSYNPVEILTNPKYEEQRQAAKEGFLSMSPIVLGGAAGGYVSDRFSQKENSTDEDTGNKSATNIDSFMKAIAGQESGGDYDAYNGMYGASGKFQILPENWSQWATDAGLDSNAPMTPENQEIVAKNKMLEYYKKFGDWRKVAEAWYGGEGAPNWSQEAKSRVQEGGYPSVNEYADSVMARFENILSTSDNDEKSEEIVYPEDFGEGKYWAKQNDGVSYEGAQPQTMQALYLLSKWFYKKTGKPLTVSAVTNGTHADGEFSHGNGWKIDVHDGNNGAEGTLFTDDFREGTFLKEFVDYGHSLGLGMNVESLGTGNVHVDVAVDGNQWIGEDAGTHYGGFNGASTKKSRSAKTKTPTADTSTIPTETYDSTVDQIVADLLKSVPDANVNFDSSRANPLEKSIYDAFVEHKKNSEEYDTARFVEFLAQNEMLKEDGTFKNSKANRTKLRQEFQEELDEYGQARINESKAKFFERQKDNDAKIISAFEKLVQQEEAEGKPVAMKHRELLQNGNVGAMESFLKNAGIDFSSGTVQTQEDMTPAQSDSLKSPVSPISEGWKNFSSENQIKLAQNLKTELSSAGMLDENLGNALDNVDQQAISDALKLFREWQKRKPVNQILESTTENLSDDAKKFRENYRQLQENIRSLEAQRSELQDSMQAAANSSDVYSYNSARNSAAEIERQLETARTDLENLTPPTSFKNISESEKLAAEITRHTHELNGLRAQIDGLGNPADKKSMRKLDRLKSQTASTYKKLLDAQERYDELNDVGKIWREGELDTSSTQEILSLLQAGMEQTQRKIDSVSRKTKKSSDDSKVTATLANLGNQLSELKSVMSTPVNPVLNVSQAMDEVSKARETLTSLATQLSTTQNNYDKAVSAGNEVDAANFLRESEEIKNQAGNLLSFAQNLGAEVDAVILERVRKFFPKCTGRG